MQAPLRGALLLLWSHEAGTAFYVLNGPHVRAGFQELRKLTSFFERFDSDFELSPDSQTGG